MTMDFPIVAAILLAVAALILVAAASPRTLLPLAVAIGILVSRPTAVGERYPMLGVAILVPCSVIGLIFYAKEARTLPKYPVLVFIAAWLWLVVHKIIVTDSEPNLLTSMITVCAPVVAFYFIARDRDLLHRVVQILVGLISASAVLTALSMVGGLIVGYQNLHLGSLPVGYTYADSAFLFPGALTYGPEVGSTMPRFLGLGREPGMGALFIGWAYFAMPPTWRWRNPMRLALLLAIAGTQSTAGIGLFAACWAIQTTFGGERFRPHVAVANAALGGWATWFALFNPTFGFIAKYSSSEGSFSDRSRATSAGLEAFFGHPFTAFTEAPLSSINLLASAAVNGAPWVVLMSLFLLAPIARAGRRNRIAYSSLFLLAVMITSQPLAGASAIMILVLVNYFSVSETFRVQSQRLMPASAVALASQPQLVAVSPTANNVLRHA